jgi:hypothetical protein
MDRSGCGRLKRRRHPTPSPRPPGGHASRRPRSASWCSGARIVRDGAEYLLEDAGSASGTYVNEVDIGRVALRDQDVVQVGMTRLRFLRD